MWQVDIITLFPELYPGPLALSVTGRSMQKGIWSIFPVNLRDFTQDKHRTVDDTPYGGGGGMILRPDILATALDSLDNNCSEKNTTKKVPIIHLSPRGTLFNQQKARDLIKYSRIILICGRFEGIDERIFEEYEIEEISVGDYILTCGDIAAFPLLDTCIRLLPGTLGNSSSIEEESFGSNQYEHLLEYSHYTKPSVWRGHEVPDVLLSGNHAKIQEWRLKRALERTQLTRPELWKQYINKREKFIKND